MKHGENSLKCFKYKELSEELRSLVHELPNIEVDDTGNAEFKVITQPDPEWGNLHIPLALQLVKQGARKGEVVLITGIE